VDPLKVKSILSLPPPNNLTQLQSLKGKEKFLHHFIFNYAEITKGFMILLQKDVHFIWDSTARCSFNALKHALMNTLLLHPLDYERDYIIYLSSSTSIISMVLVQKDDDDTEHVIYYLRKSLSGPKLRYSHVEMFSLATIIFVQIFLHYVMLPTTTVITESNPMYHILNRHVIAENIPNGSLFAKN
jgi:hypothetical protein